MYKNLSKWLSLCLAAIIFVSTILTPSHQALAAEFGEGLDARQIFSSNGTEKTEAEEAALKKGVSKSKTTRTSANVVYRGQISYGGSIVGHFEVDGKQSFCIEHPKATPPTGTQNNGGTIYNNDQIAAALYYGITGDGNIFGSDWARGTVVTSLVLSEMYLGSYQGGSSIAGYDELKAKALAGDYPDSAANFSQTTVDSEINSNVQRSETIRLNADTRNRFSFSLPSQVTFKNVTTGQTQTGGTVTIKGGDSFYLTAPLTYNTNYVSGNLRGTLKEFTSILYRMNDDRYQKLAQGMWVDPSFTIAFTAKFRARTGSVEITKKGSDGKLLPGAQYDVKNSAGQVVAHVTTNANGKIKVNDLLQGNYTVTETRAPAGYTINRTPQNITITAGQTAYMTFENKQVFFQVKLKKQDAETDDEAQGDATLVGARYGIYSDAAATNLLNEVTIGTDLTALSNKIALNGASRTVYVKEIQAPVGYNLDPTVHTVRVDQTNDTTEVFVANLTASDRVIKGGFDLIKFANKPLLQSTLASLPDGQKQALVGAEFTAKLKSTGVVAQTQTTDLDGKASFQNLPYGTYVVSETVTPIGYKPVADFEVTISEQGQQFHYILEDKVIEAKVKIVKKDKETGKVIPLAGATFKVKDSEGNFISQHINYPTERDLTEFTTASDGTLVLPEKLVYGDYTLVEVKAPNGYLLNREEIAFTISEAHDGDMITLAFSDMAAKGKVKGIKTKEVIDTEKSTQDKIVYKHVPAAGITFDIVAKENIVTPDGTVRVKAGKVVDHVTTDAKGVFASNKELYLGNYQLVETNTPKEYRDLTPVSFQLTYKNDQTNIVWANVSVQNKLKKGTVEISKKDLTGEEELPGATLNVKGKDIDVTWVSGKQAKKYTLPEGKYTLTEKIPNPGYKLNTNTITFTVKDGKVTKTVMHNEKIPAPMKKGFLPTTGDNSLDLLLYSLGTILLALGVYLLVQNRKQRWNKE
ncbi:SpaA isopeptide-forming pilin-related protein [Listeria innocua]|uniref:SpaA isopeptide-forming pilin-related protein n=3 Tax=Listeria innocua TaxID=1642 RepID=UPI0021AB51E7|nr:SpaA isopeptide-forming pilin-related protein [Listeria innocua]